MRPVLPVVDGLRAVGRQLKAGNRPGVCVGGGGVKMLPWASAIADAGAKAKEWVAWCC